MKSKLMMMLSVMTVLIAFTGCGPSGTEAVDSPTFEIDGSPVATGGTYSYSSPVEVTIHCATSGATIKYNFTNNAPPSSTYGYVYNGVGIQLSANRENGKVDVCAVGTKLDLADSELAMITLVFNTPATQCQGVLLDPNSGLYYGLVSIHTFVDGWTSGNGWMIRYTMDGSTPSATHGTSLIPGHNISLSTLGVTTLRAIVYDSNGVLAPSYIAEATYELSQGKVENPTADVPAGEYPGLQRVHLSCATAGAVEIWYTHNGLEPEKDNLSTSLPYMGEDILCGYGETVVKARAYLSGWTPSEIVTLEYTVQGWIVVGGDGLVILSSSPTEYWSDLLTSGTVHNLSDICTEGSGLYFASGIYLAGNSNNPTSFVIQSDDGGYNWQTTGYTDTANHYISDIKIDKYGLDLVVAGGFYPGSGNIQYSKDLGSSWNNAILPTTQDMHGVATDDRGHWVACGADDSATLWSSDVTAPWNQATVNYSGKYNEMYLDGVAYAGGTNWVMVGGSEDLDKPLRGIIFQSADNGHTWNTMLDNASIGLRGVAANEQGTCVAVGDGLIIYSSDAGLTWNVAVSPVSEYLGNVANDGAGNWVITGANGTILYSTDTINWTICPSRTTRALAGVVHGSESQ